MATSLLALKFATLPDLMFLFQVLWIKRKDIFHHYLEKQVGKVTETLGTNKIFGRSAANSKFMWLSVKF